MKSKRDKIIETLIIIKRPRTNDYVLKSFDWEDGIKFTDFSKLKDFICGMLDDIEEDEGGGR